MIQISACTDPLWSCELRAGRIPGVLALAKEVGLDAAKQISQASAKVTHRRTIRSERKRKRFVITDGTTSQKRWRKMWVGANCFLQTTVLP